jgi:hypothetical protein
MTDGDHIFLVYVGRREAVQEREPSAGAAEKNVAISPVGAAGVFDKFRPAVAMARQSARGL